LNRVYITDYDYSDLEIEQRVYSKYNVELIPLKCKSEEELVKKAKDAVALHNQYLKLSKITFEGIKNLRLVVRYGVGLDNINLEDAKRYNVLVKNIPDYCTEEVSNNALSMILNFVRKLKRSDLLIRSGYWDFNKIRPIHKFQNYCIGIIGLGRIGKTLVRKLISLGFDNILVNDIDSSVLDGFEHRDKIKLVNLKFLMSNSDFISLNLPLTKESAGLINKNTLCLVKDNVSIINTSRGAIINEMDLYNFLVKHTEANAGLDVLEKEPPEFGKNKLLKLDNVIFTPHSSFYSEESLIELRKRVALTVIENLN
jgi:D-3-phosphoglycerate dehydrogenase